jgi:hypothetical protein
MLILSAPTKAIGQGFHPMLDDAKNVFAVEVAMRSNSVKATPPGTPSLTSHLAINLER